MISTKYSATDMAVVIVLAAVFGPAFLQQSVPSWIIISMMWQIVGSTFIPIFNPWIMIPILPFTFMRLIVAYMIYRLYQNKTTVKRVLVIVLVSEIQPILLYDIPLLLAALQGLFPFYIPLIIPIPFLALVTLLIVRIYPPPRREVDWVEKSEISWMDDEHPAA